MLGRIGINAAQFQQIGGALQRVFQRLIRLIDRRRHHHRLPLLKSRSRRGTVGMKLRRQRAVARLQRRIVKLETLGQAE